jgi:hypothetical protein
MEGRAEFHRDNHYVPRVYLKQFAGTDGHIATYQLLVAHENVALWKRHSARSIAHQAHLYARIAAGRETDEIERWLDRHFEAPANSMSSYWTWLSSLSPIDSGRPYAREHGTVKNARKPFVAAPSGTFHAIL